MNFYEKKRALNGLGGDPLYALIICFIGIRAITAPITRQISYTG